MNDKLIIKGVTDALTGKLIYEFTVAVRCVEPAVVAARSFWDRILNRSIPTPVDPETHRDFQLYPCVAINQYRIAGMAVTLPYDLFEEENLMLAYVTEHLPKMLYIIAAAIQNNHKEPDPKLIKFLEYNLDNVDIAQLLTVSLQSTNMQSFLTSIVLMNGMAKILIPTTNPTDGRELIASHTVQ